MSIFPGQGLDQSLGAYGSEHLRTIPDATEDQRHRAVRTVASAARDATDLSELLDMLGLDPKEGLIDE